MKTSNRPAVFTYNSLIIELLRSPAETLNQSIGMGDQNRVLLITVAILSCLVHSSLIDRRLFKRQTVVSSNANTEGVADQVETEAMANHFKTTDNIVGMNVSSGGNATGHGEASIKNSADGQVGNTNISATGNVGSTGTNAQSTSDIFSNIYGDNVSISNYQQGKGEGVGDTAAVADGSAVINQNGVNSPYSSDKLTATSGAQGSLGSSSEVIASQDLTWDSVLAQLVGSAVAEGLGNAQANVDLAAGNEQNGINVNGLMSGWSDSNGNVNAQVNGNGQIDNDKHDLVGNMYGNVNGTGNSHLVGASNVQSNVTGVNKTINAFGDSNVQSDGNTNIDIKSETDLKDGHGANGEILLNATADGANKNMTGQNGIQVNDANGGTLAIGHGSIQGNGTQNSTGAIHVDTSYNEDGDTRVISNADGESKADGGNDSSLNIYNQADLTNTNGVDNSGSASGGGSVQGESSNMTGNGFLNVGADGVNGNSFMEGYGEGNGPSSADTSAGLSLNEGNVTRNSSVHGSVAASGDKTSVHSISVVTDYQGQQSLTNYQKATSQASGSSSSSASNFAILRRRKRSPPRHKTYHLGVLYDILL